MCRVLFVIGRVNAASSTNEIGVRVQPHPPKSGTLPEAFVVRCEAGVGQKHSAVAAVTSALLVPRTRISFRD